MGQKVTPIGYRLGITYKPQSQWFVDPRSGSMKKIYPPLVLEDRFIRDFITQKFPRTAIAQILIYRTLDYIKIEIHTAQAKKLSYQSLNKSSTESVSSSKEKFNMSTQASILDDEASKNKVQTEQSSLGSSKINTGSMSSVGQGNLKNLQQDLQIALCKYKKTLQIFSSWKHESFQVINNDNSLKQNSEKNNLLHNETQEFPKLWSYETNNLAVSKKSNDNLQKELTPSRENQSFTKDGPSLSNKAKVTQPIGIVVKQLNKPFQYAPIFAKYLVSQLEKRENSVKQALNRSLKLIQNYNIQGIKIKISGRLNGVDMAETENILKGRIPLSTISAKIDYYQDIAQTLYGTLGVKVFIYR